MKTTITKKELERVFDKVSNSGTLMCVCVNKSKVLVHKTTSVLIKSVIKNNYKAICGFYNQGVCFNHFVDDLEFMGVEVIG